MRIGLFGGTFNPVHLAHLRVAEEVREAFNLSRVIFTPAATPPHKTTRTGARHRLKMLELAVAGRRGFDVSDIESRRAGPSYSVDTIRQLKRQFDAATRLYFMLGEDAFFEIHTWKSFR